MKKAFFCCVLCANAHAALQNTFNISFEIPLNQSLNPVYGTVQTETGKEKEARIQSAVENTNKGGRYALMEGAYSDDLFIRKCILYLSFSQSIQKVSFEDKKQAFSDCVFWKQPQEDIFSSISVADVGNMKEALKKEMVQKKRSSEKSAHAPFCVALGKLFIALSCEARTF